MSAITASSHREQLGMAGGSSVGVRPTVELKRQVIAACATPISSALMICWASLVPPRAPCLGIRVLTSRDEGSIRQAVFINGK